MRIQHSGILIFILGDNTRVLISATEAIKYNPSSHSSLNWLIIRPARGQKPSNCTQNVLNIHECLAFNLNVKNNTGFAIAQFFAQVTQSPCRRTWTADVQGCSYLHAPPRIDALMEHSCLVIVSASLFISTVLLCAPTLTHYPFTCSFRYAQSSA